MADSFHNAVSAAGLSSLAAGPAFFAVTLLGDRIHGRSNIWEVQTADQIFTWVVLLSIAAATVAFIPILFGTLTMGSIGRGNIGFRHPAMWAMAGAALASLPFLLAGDQGSPADGMAAVGTICAVVSRLFVRWREA